MKEKPILMSAPMVRAILAGTKTQTRRTVKRNASGRVQLAGKQWHIEDRDAYKASPYGQVGDHIWVKETHTVCIRCNTLNFAATVNERRESKGKVFGVCAGCDEAINYWKPSIFMRRKYSRITLEIQSVKVERLQDISESDAMAEGIIKQTVTVGRKEGRPDYDVFALRPGNHCQWEMSAKDVYRKLWESINGKGSWELNPWVWAISFQRPEAK